MNISEIPELAQGRAVISLETTATVQDAVDLIKEHNIGAIPVTKDEKLVGVFSERDIIKRVIAEKLDPEKLSVFDVMTPDPDFVSSDCPVSKAIDLMVTNRYRHMPVVDNDKLVGFLSQRDFMAMSWMELLKYKATHPDT